MICIFIPRRKSSNFRPVDSDDETPGTAIVTMFEEPYALPCAESEAAARDGDGERGRGESTLDVTGHVIGALLGMPDGRASLLAEVWDDSVQMGLHVVEDVGVCILADCQTLCVLKLGQCGKERKNVKMGR